MLPESATNVGDGDTSVPLLADILPGIIGADLQVLETIVAKGIIAIDHHVVALAIDHLLQVESPAPDVRLDAIHQLRGGRFPEIALRGVFRRTTQHHRPRLTVESQIGNEIAIALLFCDPRS